MCKAALTGSDDAARLGATFNRAIIVMLIAPYAVLLALSAAFFSDHISLFARRITSKARSTVALFPSFR